MRVHNSDLRDSREYIQKQVWGQCIFTRHSIERFNLVGTRLTVTSVELTDMILLNPHTAYMFGDNLCTHWCHYNLSCA